MDTSAKVLAVLLLTIVGAEQTAHGDPVEMWRLLDQVLTDRGERIVAQAVCNYVEANRG